MRRSFISVTMMLWISSVTLAGQSFDRRVSEARRHMRASCQAVQNAAKTSETERASIRENAANQAVEALRLWTDLTKEFAASVPGGYAGDPAWVQRLEDIRLNIARMGKEIAVDEWRPAFLSCAHACNLLATMHEANGVNLAIDAMSVLRKKVGFARGFLAAGKPDKARSLAKDILAARDAVLLAPPPDTPNRDTYLQALPDLTRAVDALAVGIRGGADIKGAFEKLAAVVERVYELAI